MAQSDSNYVGAVALYPMGACKTSMLVIGCEHDLVVQLGWDAEPAIKPGEECHLYKFGKSYFVAKEQTDSRTAKSRADSLFKKAVEKSTTK